MDQPKLDKHTLSLVVEAAKVRFKERGNCDGNEYLTSGETIARAYIEAALAVLSQQGFQVVKSQVSSD